MIHKVIVKAKSTYRNEFTVVEYLIQWFVGKTNIIAGLTTTDGKVLVDFTGFDNKEDAFKELEFQAELSARSLIPLTTTIEAVS